MAWLYWDPPTNAFTIPFLNHSVAWYGILFVLGLVLSYVIVLHIMRVLLVERSQLEKSQNVKDAALSLTDRLTWFVVIGIIVGARLFHVFFYDWPLYKQHPNLIYKIWEGGLASHGGALGIILAVIFFRLSIQKKYPAITFWTIIDTIAVPAALAGACIRFGNFINQEILGTPSKLPWAIIFGHPADKSESVPRHPVQLYEAFAYLIIFGLMFYIWQWTRARWYPGFITGIFFILLFTARFFLEFFKSSQSIVIDESYLQMGQYLSFPFIIAGFILIFYSSNRKLLN